MKENDEILERQDADEDESCFSETFEIDEDEFRHEKCVVGYYEDEERLEQMPDRSDYSNWEVNEWLWDYFRFFGAKDMDIIYLCFLLRKKQEDVMAILRKSQPAVSYDVSRIGRQIEFVTKMNSCIDDFIVYVTDPGNGMSTRDREILTVFFYTTSIVKTARVLKLKNVTCRSRISTIVNHIKMSGRNDIYEIFQYIMTNLNNVKKKVDKTSIDDLEK